MSRIITYALGLMCILGFAAIPAQLIEHYIVGEQTSESRYLPAPGNRTRCPDSKNGRTYAGYISTQSDGMNKPVITKCFYLDAKTMRGTV